MNLLQKDCPCFSGKNYDVCCRPFHEGALPKNALQLMRSRYAAYATGQADYIIATTHPTNPHYSKDFLSWRRSIFEFSEKTSFCGLEILSFEEQGSLATVAFKAHLMQGNRDVSFTEKSLFKKEGEKWLYAAIK